MHRKDDTPLELDYAPRGSMPRPQMPPDKSVLRGLKGIVAAVVLLPFVFGAIVLFFILLGGEGCWLETWRSIIAIE